MARVFVAVLIFFTCLAQGVSLSTTETPDQRLQAVVPCEDKKATAKFKLRCDRYLVLYNYVKAKRPFHCWESITLTTHGHFNDLHHLQELLQRWRGPVSLALHAPETFITISLYSINWAKTCIPLVNELVTFHIFFEYRTFTRPVSFKKIMDDQNPNCSKASPWSDRYSWEKLKILKRVPYPVNVARNIARESATTYFVLSSDIDLYPSPGIIDDFMEMVQQDDKYINETTRKVFPIPAFEITPESLFPQNKIILKYMVKYENARFYSKDCETYQIFPQYRQWLRQNLSHGLHVFKESRRIGRFANWEPIYIGTNREPFYDERLFSEGKFERTEQAYALCLQDYEFFILDNAYLIYSPGMEVKEITKKTYWNYRLLKTTISKTLKHLYGSRDECRLTKESPNTKERKIKMKENEGKKEQKGGKKSKIL